MRRWGSLLLFSVCGWLGSCTSLTTIPNDPVSALTDAKTLIDAKDYDQAVATLEYYGAEPLSLEDKARWHLLGGTALFAAGEPWDAYQWYSRFIREHSIPVPQLGDLTYRIGDTLAKRGGGFWPFWSDRNDAVAVLRTFVGLYSTRPQMPDALHRLGEIAFEDGKYERARQRFTQLITGRYQSVWNTKAAFRVAMCYYRQLTGADYDLEGMHLAQNELADFLKGKIENPTYRREAEAALRQVREWLGEKHLHIAAFYRTLKNAVGERHHLRIALSQFGETRAASAASTRLKQLTTAPETQGPSPEVRR